MGIGQKAEYAYRVVSHLYSCEVCGFIKLIAEKHFPWFASEGGKYQDFSSTYSDCPVCKNRTLFKLVFLRHEESKE